MTLLALALAATGLTTPDRKTVVVMPPEGAGETAWVGEAVAELLPLDLALLGTPAVESPDRLRAQEALSIPQTALSRASAIRLAEGLVASRVVIGTREVEGASLTLSLRALDLERGTLSAPFRASGPLDTLLDLVHGLAWDLALAGPTHPVRSREELARGRGAPFDAVRAWAEALAGDGATRVPGLRKALALAPGFDEARLSLGRLLVKTREHAAALEVLGRLAPGSPFERSAAFLRGVALLELGRHHDAAMLFGALARQDPTPASLNNHALALLRLGTPARDGIKASDVLRKAAELAPGARDLVFNLGWALLVEGDAEAAGFWLRGLVRQQPADAQARLALVWSLRVAGHAEAADEEWKGLLAVASSYEAMSEPQPGRRLERVATSERLLLPGGDGRSDAELAAVHVGRAEKLTQSGDRAAAQRELTQAVVLDPYSARGHLLLARAHLAGGDQEKAVSELRVSLWCHDEVPVRLELALLLKAMGRAAEAKAEAERVLQAQPGNAAARKLLAGS